MSFVTNIVCDVCAKRKQIPTPGIFALASERIPTDWRVLDNKHICSKECVIKYLEMRKVFGDEGGLIWL